LRATPTPALPHDENHVIREGALNAARRALELADEQAKDIPVERDYVRAHWLCVHAKVVRRQEVKESAWIPILASGH
jgi:hypothetical protein